MKGVPHPPRCRGSNPGASLIRTRGIAQAGEEKVAMAPAPPPAPEVLIIEDQFDLRMPVMNGWVFRQQQQASPTLAVIPVVVMSGEGDVGQEAATLQAAGH